MQIREEGKLMIYMEKGLSPELVLILMWWCDDDDFYINWLIFLTRKFGRDEVDKGFLKGRGYDASD